MESGRPVRVMGNGMTTSGVMWMRIDWKGEHLISVHYDGSVMIH